MYRITAHIEYRQHREIININNYLKLFLEFKWSIKPFGYVV